MLSTRAFTFIELLIVRSVTAAGSSRHPPEATMRHLCLLLAICLANAAESIVTRIIDTGSDVPWVQGEYVSAGGRVQLADDAPPGVETKRCIEMIAEFPGRGFMFYNAEPAKPLLVPGRLQKLTLWHKGPGGIINLRDGWNRSEYKGRKFEWSLTDASAGWKQSTFAIPVDWVQPIRISGVATHNWGEDAKQQSKSIRLAAIEAVYDLSDTDPATGALKSWQPDPEASSRKDAPTECPRTPMLELSLASGREANVFAGESASLTVSARSWRSGRSDGTLSWRLIDISSGAAAEKPVASGSLDVVVENRPFGASVPMPTARLGLYRVQAVMAWKDGVKDERSIDLAVIGAVPKDDAAARDASPYGLNTHGGGKFVCEAWNKAGVRWIRDYAWGFGQMKKARDQNGAFTGWPWYPKLQERYKKYGFRLLPCMMDGIPAADGGVPQVPVTWRKEMSAIFAAFPDITHWELANEWDLDWENKHGAKLDREKDWPAYRAYHKAFGQVVGAVGATAVENGRAGCFPEDVRSMVKDGSFADIPITNGHFYTGVDTPELNASNANTGGGGSATSRKLCYQDLLRESYRSSQADGKKRTFWLTEFGYDTKAGFIVSHFQQAAYLQRAWMMSFANQVEKSFWFFDFDANKSTAFFDGCGIMNDTVQPKLSYCSLAALTRILPNPTYRGPLDAGPDTWGYLFEDHGTLVAALWTVEQAEGPRVTFASGKLVDFLGNPVPGTSVKLGLAPVFCVGVAPTDRWAKQASYEVDGLRLLDLAAGDRVDISVAITNHRAAPLKGRLRLHLPEGWKALADDQSVEAAPGVGTKAGLACTINPNAKPGEYQVGVVVEEDGTALCELRVRVLVGPALTISVPTLGNQPGTSTVAVTVVNRSQRALDGTVTPQLPTGWKAEPTNLPVSQLAPGASQVLPMQITWNAQWKPGEEAWMRVATRDGVNTRAALQPGVITIPRLAKFTADGDLGEWPASARLPEWVVGCTEGMSNAEIRLAWCDQGLVVAVQAKDSRVQNSDPKAFWEMDALELFVSSTASFTPRAFVATDHQFWLVPLPAEQRVFLGRWKRNDEIPATMYDVAGLVSHAKAIPGGYRYEALIPAVQINGFIAKAGASCSIDLILSINGATGKREVYWPWGKKDDAGGKPQNWGLVHLGE